MKKAFIALALLAILVGAWWKVHKSCPVCQERWRQIKRQIGLRLVE